MHRFFAVVICVFGCASLHGEAIACASSAVEVSKEHPTANFHACEVLDPYAFELVIMPEDEPINPSPWYGFAVKRINDKEAPITIKIKYEVAPHRYEPKVSVDRKNWTPLDEQYVKLIDEYTVILTIPPTVTHWFVSAQPILDEEFYLSWMQQLQQKYPFIHKEILGYSVGKRSIYAIAVNPDAKRVIVMLGRQHPPEVPGAFAFQAFAEALLKLMTSIDSQDQSLRAFFREHMLVFVPLLNPDGVQEGYWRHNLRGKDLNRDWFSAAEPEVRAVQRYLGELTSQGKEIALHLDFHSTRRDVFYTQMPDDQTDPPDFATRWIDLVKQRGLALVPEHAPRPLTEQGTAKGYFFKTYGIPSITYEVGDESKFADVVLTAQEFAYATAVMFGKASSAAQSLKIPPCEVLYCFMLDANAASLVGLNEQSLIDGEVASNVAGAQLAFMRDAVRDGWPSGQNYLTFEAHLIELLGEEASNIHAGRSRQDLHGVARRMLARKQTLRFYDALLEVRLALLDVAAANVQVVIPAYTHGVPSQPTTYAHVLLAFDQALARDTQRLQSAFTRLNRSQLGVAAGSGSSFPLDRERLAHLLGFDAAIANTFDANFLSTADYKLEIISVLEQGVATISKYIANIHAQQRNPRPWIYLTDELTSGSSIMPQKRNPRELDRIRALAAKVNAGATEQRLLNSNLDTGMHDYRSVQTLIDTLAYAETLYQRFAVLLREVHVDSNRALAELEHGFSTSTEIADLLFREVGMPFRTAHEYAKRIVELARSTDRKLTELEDDELASVYIDVFGKPMRSSLALVRRAMDPVHFVEVRTSPGGPAPSETANAQLTQRAKLADDHSWLNARQNLLADAEYRLRSALSELATRSD